MARGLPAVLPDPTRRLTSSRSRLGVGPFRRAGPVPVGTAPGSAPRPGPPAATSRHLAGGERARARGPRRRGKSVAASQAAAAAGGPTAWCRLAPGYGDVADLVGLAAAALGRPPPDELDAGADVLVLAGTLLDLLEPVEATLVVDDYHHADNECDALLGEIAVLLAPGMRVVVATRSRPAGLLGRLPSGAARVLDGDDLAFSPEEAEALLGQSAPGWHAATGGWAAGLAMVADAAPGGP